MKIAVSDSPIMKEGQEYPVTDVVHGTNLLGTNAFAVFNDDLCGCVWCDKLADRVLSRGGLLTDAPLGATAVFQPFTFKRHVEAIHNAQKTGKAVVLGDDGKPSIFISIPMKDLPPLGD